jgi:hypothetical protein
MMDDDWRRGNYQKQVRYWLFSSTTRVASREGYSRWAYLRTYHSVRNFFFSLPKNQRRVVFTIKEWQFFEEKKGTNHMEHCCITKCVAMVRASPKMPSSDITTLLLAKFGIHFFFC